MAINNAFKMEKGSHEADHIDLVCEAEHWNVGAGNAKSPSK